MILLPSGSYLDPFFSKIWVNISFLKRDTVMVGSGDSVIESLGLLSGLEPVTMVVELSPERSRLSQEKSMTTTVTTHRPRADSSTTVVEVASLKRE